MLLAFIKARLQLSDEWRRLEGRRRADTKAALLRMFNELDRASFSMTRASMGERAHVLAEEHLDRVLGAAFPLDDVLEIAVKLQGGS